MSQAERHNRFVVPVSAVVAPDMILGLNIEHGLDSRTDKINAGVGVYCGENGETFTPEAVKRAYSQLDLGAGDYIGPTGEEEMLGNQNFLRGTAELYLGAFGKESLVEKTLVAAGTPGGTGAVALFADVAHVISPDSPLLIGTPTWPNHLQIAKHSEMKVITYSHAASQRYDADGHILAVKKSPENTIVLFHAGLTHNPTGTNPATSEEWRQLAKAMEGRTALFDAPYAGLGKDIETDTEAMRIFLEEGVQIAVAVSYSKNGGIYKERAGALLIPTDTREDALKMQRLVNSRARMEYSSPSALGERLMATVLQSSELNTLWQKELMVAAENLQRRREAFSLALPEYDFVAKQSGLFSMLPLTGEQTKRLKTEYGVYMPENGRVNFGGVPLNKIPQFTEAIQRVQ